MYPYLPAHVTRPKEVRKLFVGPLPEKGFFEVRHHGNCNSCSVWHTAAYCYAVHYEAQPADARLPLSFQQSGCASSERH